MATAYSTTDVPPHERIAYWNKIVSAGFAKLIVKAGDDFNGRLTVGTIGLLGVSTFECDPLSVYRGPREISRTDGNDYYICLQQSGRSTHIQGDRTAAAGPGDFFLLDPRRPFIGHLQTRGTMVTIRAARQGLEARTGPTGPLISRKAGAPSSCAFGSAAQAWFQTGANP